MPRLRLKDYLVIAGGILLIALSLSVAHVNVADSTPPGPFVTVVNTPLPVTLQGTGSISGTVAATQSGTWNVGITNAADLAKALGIGQPVMFSSSLTDNGGISSKFHVPANQRLIIEYVSGSCFVGNAEIDELEVVVQTSGQVIAGTAVDLAVSALGAGNQTTAAFGHLARIYAGPGTDVDFEVTSSAGGGGSTAFSCSVHFSGQLVSVP